MGHSGRLRIAIAVAASAAALGVQHPASAQPLRQPPANVAQAYQYNSWSLVTGINRTDNFSRIEDGDYLRLFELDDGSLLTQPTLVQNPDGTFAIVLQPVSDTVPIEAFGKTFTTLTFEGNSIFNRSSGRGLINGRVRVGSYVNADTIAEVYEDRINSNLPQVAIDAGATPTIGDIPIDRQFIDPNISGLIELDVVDDLVGFEAGGFVIEQQLLGIGGQLQAQLPGQDFNQIILGGAFLSPVVSADFANDQELELRYRNSSIVVLDEINAEIAAFPGGGLQINDSVSNEASVRYRSGRMLPFGELELVGFVRNLVEEGADNFGEEDLDQTSGAATLSVPVASRLKVFGVVGYDDLSVERADSPAVNPDTGEPVTPGSVTDLSGPYFAGGIEYRPTERSQIRFSVGERYQGTLFDVSASMALTPRLVFAASANRQVTSGTQNLQDTFSILNSQALRFTNRAARTNERLSDRSVRGLNTPMSQFASPLGAGFGILPGTRLVATLTGNYGRTNVSLGANAQLFDDTAEEALPGLRSDLWGTTGTVTRQVSRRLSVTASGQMFRNEGFAGGGLGTGSIVNYLATVQANYTLNRNWGVDVSYRHLRQNVDSPNAGTLSLFGGTLFEFRENQFQAGMRYVF